VILTEQLEWEGRTIACGRAGTGPDVVFCHGTPWSSRTWSAYADALAAEFTVHLWDMPGYGASSKHPDHPVDFGAQGRALAAVLDHFGLERPHVVAHDFGGATALRATLAEGATYASLLLVDVVAIPPSGSPFFRFVQEHAEVLPGLPAYVHEAVVRAYVGGASHRGLHADDLDELVAPWLGDEGRPAFYRQIAQYDESYLEDHERRLGELTCPTRVVWGAEDAWIPPQTGRRLAALLDTEYVELPGAGHLVQYDAPVALTAEIRRWLAAS
jgi:pimeloyl-ACP methyl ester carboxylesterase